MDEPEADRLDPAEDDTLRGICLCRAPYHMPFCRIGVMLARLERPSVLRTISVT